MSKSQNSDNSYILKVDEERNVYVVSFKDYKGVMQNVEVTKEIYPKFPRNYTVYLRQL